MAKYPLDPQFRLLNALTLPLWRAPAVPLQADMLRRAFAAAAEGRD